LLGNTDTIEAWLVSHLATRLHLDPSRIALDRPIVTLGIDSLTALELTHDIEVALNITLPVSDVLKGASVAELAVRAADQFNLDRDAREAVLQPAVDTNGLSHGQRALWFLNRLAPASPAYNLAFAARVLTKVDSTALRQSFQALVNRHSVLRTTFPACEGKPLQQVHDKVEISLQEVDASSFHEADLHNRLVAEANAPFDLARGPLFRVSLFTPAAGPPILLLVVHHIVADFWSLALLCNELGKLYEAHVGGTTVPLNHALQYSDYVRWQAELLQSDEGKRKEAYWKKQLAADVPVLNLPADKDRPAFKTYNGDSCIRMLDADISRQVHRFCEQNETTVFVALLAAFEILLNRYTSEDEFFVGCPTTGRSHAEFAGVAGYFVNPVVLRANLSEDLPVRAFVRRIRETVLEALENQD